MQTSTLLSMLAAASLTIAAPQGTSLNDLPACAQQAGLAAIDATGCSLGDISCICNSVPFISTLRSYIEAHCTATDQAAALTYGQTTCAPYGVTFSATVSGITATPTPAGTATSTMTLNRTNSVSSASWTTGLWEAPTSAPTANSSSTATLLPYTGAAAAAGKGGFMYEVAVVLAGAVGVAAFLV